MKQGLTLVQLAEQVQASMERKHDVIVDTRKMTVLASEEGGTTLTLPADSGVDSELELLPHTHRQLGGHLKVRADFYDRLRDGHPGLFNGLINGLLREHNPGPQMIRTYRPDSDGGPGVARAFLSNRYRRIDHDRILGAVMPVLGKLPGVEFHSTALTDKKLYIKAVVPTVAYDLNEFIDPSKHVMVNDVVQAGVVIKNSEVGVGGFDVEQLIYRLVCQNGMIVGKLLSKRHVGRRIAEGEDLNVYADDTLEADDKALMLKLRDQVAAAVDDTAFRVIVKDFAEAKDTTPMEDPIKATEVLSQNVGLTEREGRKVLEHLLRDGDLTKFGAMNAVTRASQDVEDYDRATELEELGADVMRMGAREWDAIAAAA
jgi:hypothetical protein